MSSVQEALDRIPSPVGLVVAGSKEDSKVITVSWFTQVSQHPPLVAVSISPNASVTPLIAQDRTFVLSLLGGEQEEIARTCGQQSDVVPDKFKAANLSLSDSTRINTPYIQEALMNLECRVVQQTIVGDHCIYIAKTEAAHTGQGGKQLVFADRDLFSL